MQHQSRLDTLTSIRVRRRDPLREPLSLRGTRPTKLFPDHRHATRGLNRQPNLTTSYPNSRHLDVVPKKDRLTCPTRQNKHRCHLHEANIHQQGNRLT
jgi:hypothetical protein